jgi:hypothetical protein
LIISSRISSSARFLLCGSIVSVKYRWRFNIEWQILS